MLGWWQSQAVDRVDIAVRRSSGAMIWHRDLPLGHIPLAWMRTENARGAEVYIRPARGSAWPLVFLDDVETNRALAVAGKYAALVVRTSAAGGCHVWLACNRRLDERERATAQRWLAGRIDADLASISGEHLGRFAGFRNWKRHGVWVNVLDAKRTVQLWDSSRALNAQAGTPYSGGGDTTRPTTERGLDTSTSGREWAWVCSLLEAGRDPADVYRRLVEHARLRRGDDAERYASLTIERALRRSSRWSRPPVSCFAGGDSAMRVPRPEPR